MWIALTAFVLFQAGARIIGCARDAFTREKGEVLRSIPSPSGDLEAVLIEYGGMAATSADYDVTIIQKGQGIESRHPVFSADDLDPKRLSIRWRGRSLVVGVPLGAREYHAETNVTINGTRIAITYLHASGPIIATTLIRGNQTRIVVD